MIYPSLSRSGLRMPQTSHRTTVAREQTTVFNLAEYDSLARTLWLEGKKKWTKLRDREIPRRMGSPSSACSSWRDNVGTQARSQMTLLIVGTDVCYFRESREGSSSLTQELPHLLF